MTKALTILLIFTSSFLLAQAPQVLDVSPSAHQNDAMANASINVTFDTPIDLSTVAYGNFKVFGRWSGPAEVAFSMSNNDQSVEMTPFEPFMAGEQITVTLTKSIKSANGQNMEHSYVWYFWIRTNSTMGDPIITLDKTIQLREPGEGLLQSYGAYAGDLNNDGFSDLTVVNETSDDLRILLNDGTGDYNDFEIIPMGSSTPSPNEGADFDGDGEIDLAVCTAHDNKMRVLFGDGTGTLSDIDNYTTGMNARGLGIIELNGDGNDDIVIANRQSSDLTFFINDGFGEFTSMTIDPPGTGESGLVVTDFNNDGIQDLVVGMYTSEELVIMIGDENMGFTVSQVIPALGKPWMLTAGDIDNDGFVDIVSANSSGDNVMIFFNNGNGGILYSQNNVDALSSFPLAVDLGDLNGDGFLDIVASYYSSSNFNVMINDGNSGFELLTSLDAPNHASCAILHDRDNDGFLEISGTDEGDDVLLLFNVEPAVVSVNDLSASMISSVYPNPFSNEIIFDIGDGFLDGSISIYNQLGQLVKTMLVNQQGKLNWDGTNTHAKPVPSGVYFVRIKNEQQLEILNIIKI